MSKKRIIYAAAGGFCLVAIIVFIIMAIVRHQRYKKESWRERIAMHLLRDPATGAEPTILDEPQLRPQDGTAGNKPPEGIVKEKVGWHSMPGSGLGWFDIATGGEIINFERVDAEKVHIPFLSERLVRMPLLLGQMAVSNVVFRNGGITYTNSHLTYVQCLFEETSGRLLQVEISNPNVGRLPGEVPLKDAEMRYMHTGERYHGFPEHPPSASLQQILNKIPGASFGQAARSQRITVTFLVASQIGIREEAPVWVVQCRGFPPYPSFSPDRGAEEDPSERTHLRFLFTEYGDLIQVDNQP